MPSSRCSSERPVDLMIVIGGYNSSNTCNLARICAASRPTFHIADPDCLVSADEIRHRPVGGKGRGDRRRAGCPRAGPVTIGLTSGASTPDNLVGRRRSPGWPNSPEPASLTPNGAESALNKRTSPSYFH